MDAYVKTSRGSIAFEAKSRLRQIREETAMMIAEVVKATPHVYEEGDAIFAEGAL